MSKLTRRRPRCCPSLNSLESRILLSHSRNTFAVLEGQVGSFSSPSEAVLEVSAAASSLPQGRAIVGLELEGLPDEASPRLVRLLPREASQARILLRRPPSLGRTAETTSLALVSQGSFTTFVGSSSGSGSYRLSAFLAGDANADFRVDNQDLDLIRSLAGQRRDSDGYQVEADADRNGIINATDFLAARRNQGVVIGQPSTPVIPPSLRVPVFRLDARSDSGNLGDDATDEPVVILTGRTNGGATVVLQQTGASTIADEAGQFQFAEIPLNLGQNAFTVQASSAGMTETFSRTITRLQPDQDDDDLTDQDEIEIYRTDPMKFDTDGDLLPDGFEVIATGLDPLQVDDALADLDLDGLTNLDEVIYRTRADLPDTDNDFVWDKPEVDQGSDPRDPSDGGMAPPEDELVEVTLSVGDPSSSNSERYNLHVGPITHQATQFGVVETATYKLRRGMTYPVKIVHTGSSFPPDRFDFDYVARIASSDPDVVIEDPEGILGNHSAERPGTDFFAAGKSALLRVSSSAKPDIEALEVEHNPSDETLTLRYAVSGQPGAFEVLFEYFEPRPGDPNNKGPRIEEERRTLTLTPNSTNPQEPFVIDLPSRLQGDVARRHFVRVTVDPNGLIDEENEANNSVEESIRPFVEYIPEIQERLGFNLGASFLRRWFDGRAVEARSRADLSLLQRSDSLVFPPNIVDWVLSRVATTDINGNHSSRVENAYNELISVDITGNTNSFASRLAIGNLRNRLSGMIALEQLRRPGQFPIRIDFGDFNESPLGLRRQAMQSSSIGESRVPLDPAGAAFGKFALYAVPKGTVLVERNGRITGTITELGVFLLDSFEFFGPEPLGAWKYPDMVSNELSVIVNPFNDFKSISNSDFQEYRAANNRGMDFLITSQPKVVDIEDYVFWPPR